MILGFDIISDLNLSIDDTFNWEDKPTSLYCIVAGNISNDLAMLQTVLDTLGNCYQGVFFIDGELEHSTVIIREKRSKEIEDICKPLKNVIYLHDNVVVLNEIAIVAVNGWHGNYKPKNKMAEIELIVANYDDVSYLCSTIHRLQVHSDVKHILMVSSSVPTDKLYYGEEPNMYETSSLTDVFEYDTEKKISHRIFGTYGKIVDTVINNINYLNNPCNGSNPYYAKRLEFNSLPRF
jgi:hypothetical protein